MTASGWANSPRRCAATIPPATCSSALPSTLRWTPARSPRPGMWRWRSRRPPDAPGCRGRSTASCATTRSGTSWSASPPATAGTRPGSSASSLTASPPSSAAPPARPGTPAQTATGRPSRLASSPLPPPASPRVAHTHGRARSCAPLPSSRAAPTASSAGVILSLRAPDVAQATARPSVPTQARDRPTPQPHTHQVPVHQVPQQVGDAFAAAILPAQHRTLIPRRTTRLVVATRFHRLASAMPCCEPHGEGSGSGCPSHRPAAPLARGGGRIPGVVVVLNIGKVLRGMDAKHYFLDRVARDQRDYYTGAGEAPGEWAGAAAADLEVAGEVSEDGFLRILYGAHPA